MWKHHYQYHPIYESETHECKTRPTSKGIINWRKLKYTSVYNILYIYILCTSSEIWACLNAIRNGHTLKWHDIQSARKLDNKNTAAYIGINHFSHRLHRKMGPNASSTAQAGTTIQRWKSSKYIAPSSHWQVNLIDIIFCYVTWMVLDGATRAHSLGGKGGLLLLLYMNLEPRHFRQFPYTWIRMKKSKRSEQQQLK